MKSPASTSSGKQVLPFQDWSSLRYHLYHAYEGPVWPAARKGVYRQLESDVSCWLLLNGRVTITSERKPVTARKGQWVIVTAAERQQAFSDDTQLLSLRFHFSWPGGVPVVKPPSNLVFEAQEVPQLEKNARSLIRHVRRRFPKAAAFLPQENCTMDDYLCVQNLLPVWLAGYLQALARLGIYPYNAKHMDDRVLEGVLELDRHPLMERFSERALLERVGLGRSQYDALFVAAMGMTPRRYLERRRLEAAKNLLTHTKVSIKEISFRLGFRHASHFSLWFGRLQEISASAYREEHSLDLL